MEINININHEYGYFSCFEQIIFPIKLSSILPSKSGGEILENFTRPSCCWSLWQYLLPSGHSLKPLL